MGFYLRKSVSVGPLRFNLSKSGVGVSAGFKGFRIGTGPRGNYVHMGRGGLYYRATIPRATSSQAAPRFTPSPAASAGQPQPTGPTHEPMQEIESALVTQIVDSSSKELLNELNEKRKKVRLWPISAGVGAFLLFMTWMSGAPGWALGLLAVMGAGLTAWAAIRDQLRKTVVLFYEFDTGMEAAYTHLHAAAAELAQCAKTWHIAASGRVLDRKYHAGAGQLVKRFVTHIRRAEPPYVKSNIETIAVEVGKQVLHFFPDRVLVYAPEGVGGVDYRSLTINVGETNFIEDEGVPSDSTVVGHTWRYVNKSGGPDRRFKDNRQIPICRYSEITLQSGTGLNELIQLSKAGIGPRFASAVRNLANVMPAEA